jgi:lipopolysaccharide transport protein LptA
LGLIPWVTILAQDTAPPAPAAPAPATAVTPDAVAPAAAAPEPAPKPRSDKVDITADTMDMDFSARVATFEGSVLVVDARMALQCDKLVAHYSETSELTRIEATGNVTINQSDISRRAMAGRAEYDLAKGSIVLTETPTLRDGPNSLSGAEKITYFRDAARVMTEGGRPTITVIPKEGDVKDTALPDLLNKAKDNDPKQ